MKVLEVASSLFEWGGIERYVHYLDEGLTALGHEVTVVCPTGSPLDHKSRRDVLISNRAKYSPRTLLAFYRVGKQLRPDIAHIHFSPDFIVPAVALKRSCQAKLVMTRHLVLPWKPARVKKYCSLYDHIIPVSEAVERKLAESGVPKRMMSVAKAGVPDPPETTGSVNAKERLTVGVFGRLVEEKGVDTLLEAAKLAPRMDVHVYGEGPERQKLEQMASRAGVEERVHFCGHIADVAKAMSEVDLVCVPSKWDEAFPYSILEAMAVGKPVVASNSGGIPEVVEPGKTGWLFEKGNARELADILTRLSGSKSELAKMGSQARSVQRAEYTIARMAERIEAVFRRVLEG